jgi:hypothetical protein
MYDLSAFFRRPPYRGHKAELAEQRDRDRIVQRVLDRQRERQAA